jgi:RND superfamily putative drug exporter
MDHHVFVVSRVREAARAGIPMRRAVTTGVTRSAGVVTSAAVLMVAVFSIFATLSMLEFEQLGIGLAVAVLVDATLAPGRQPLTGKLVGGPSSRPGRHPS